MNNERKVRLQNLFRENEIGAFLLWRSDELVMALEYQPLWGTSVCLFPMEGYPILYIPELEPRDRLPEDIIVKTFPWGVLGCPNPWEILYAMIKEDIYGLGLQDAPVSFVKNTGQSSPPIMSGEGAPLPPDFVEKLMALSKAGYKDMTHSFLKLYAIKNGAEIKHITLANKVAAIGIKAFYEHLIPGKSEVEVASAVEAAIQNTVNDTTIWYARAWVQIQSGVNAAFGGTFNRSTGKKLKEGELVMIEMGVCVNGYWADITRTGGIGPLNKAHEKLFMVVRDAQEKAVQAIAPGKTTGEIDRVARHHIAENGYGKHFNHALGHHVGFRYHDPGDLLLPNGESVLEEGMIYTVEPGIYSKEMGTGARIEDNVLVTSTGYKVLSDFPRELQWQ